MLISNNIKEGIIPNQELQERVFMPNILVSNSHNTAKVPILNINAFEIEIDQPSFELIEIESKVDSHSVNFLESNNESLLTNQQVDKATLLHQNLRLDHLNSEERNSILTLCERFSHIFHLPNDNLTSTKTLKHSIPTSSNIPVSSKIYRLPKVHEQEAEKQIKEMLSQNIIEESSSPWSSPIWVVPKKRDASGTQKWRLVVDFRKLNSITIGDKFPLPNIESILDKLGNSVYFTTLDLASGFYQIEMSPEDKPKTAFSVPNGHFQYTRMAMGLRNAPSTFQRLMTIVLSGLQGSHCFVYLDDIVVFGSTLQDHNDKLTAVFKKLEKHDLRLQPDKCEFLCREISYLGHVINDKGVQTLTK